LTDDLFRSKIPLEFKAERLEEHPKPTGVEVEGLEILTGSPETDRLAYKEVVDSHRAPRCMNHIELKVVARRIQVEEPSRLVIRRKPPEEVLRIEMLKHAVRMDNLTLEIFHGHAVSAINVLFKDSSSESTRALGIRTCAESPAMLTKRSHVTALRVVATHTQVLHTDNYSVTGWLRKIATIAGYEEWDKRRTMREVLQLRAMATAAKATIAATRATAMMTTMTLLSTDQWPVEIDCAVRWKQGAMSASTKPNSSWGSRLSMTNGDRYTRDYDELRSKIARKYDKNNGSNSGDNDINNVQHRPKAARGRNGSLVDMERGGHHRASVVPIPMAAYEQAVLEFKLRPTHHLLRALTALGKRTDDRVLQDRPMPLEVDDSLEERTHRLMVLQVQRAQYATRYKCEATLWNHMQDLIRIATRQRGLKSEQEARRARSTEATPVGLEGPNFMFRFQAFYLHLRRFREYDFLQGIHEATTNHERSMAKQLRRLQFDLWQRSPKIRDLTDMGTERDGPSFYFSCATFYSQLGHFRVDNNVEEGTHLYTVQQRISKSQQDVRDVRSIEAMPSGLEGPSLSLLFKLFYLQLLHFRDREFLQSINKSLSVDALTVQRSRSGRPATASLQDEDAYITVDRSELVGRHVVERLAKGDSIPVMDIVQRHHEVSFYLGDITDERDMLDILERLGVVTTNALLRRGAKDPSIYFRAYVEGTRAVIEAAIAAGVLPYLEKLFDMYNLLPYRSTTSSEPRLAPEGVTAKLDESLHRAPPPICATTEYHRMMQTLSSYVAPTPDAGSILSAHNTPFDPHEPTGFVVRSRADKQASFVTGGEQIYILEATELFDESKVLDQVEVQLLISEGKEDAKYPSTKEKAIDRDGQLETVHQYLVSGLRPPDCEVGGRSSGSNEVSACNRRSRRPIFEAGPKIYRSKVTCSVMIRAYTTLKCFVSSSEEVVNEDG
ncbi:hypothetical protein M404DRAFT_28533, partial [Pisolithus tinctorius Marx 270]